MHLDTAQTLAWAKKHFGYLDPARVTMVVVADSKQVLPQLQGIARVVKSK